MALQCVQKPKYSLLTDCLSPLVTKTLLVALMVVKIPKEYLSTFNRQLQTQLYNELMQDYSFPRAVCRSLSEFPMRQSFDVIKLGGFLGDTKPVNCGKVE